MLFSEFTREALQMIFKALQMVRNVVKLNRAKYGTRHGRGGRRLATTYKVTHRPSGRQRQVAVGGVVGTNVHLRFALFLQEKKQKCFIKLVERAIQKVTPTYPLVLI